MRQFKVFFAIIATLIGAGFASGQEIYTFFYAYGIKGILGLAICSFLFAIIIFKLFLIVNSYNLKSYSDLVKLLFRRYGFIVNVIVNLFMLITFFIMIAGFGAYFAQEVGISTYIGSFILACLCFFTFMTSTEGVLHIGSILVPILMFFIILISFINLNSLDFNSAFEILNNLNTNGYNWLLNSILYASYNSILLIPVLITLKKNVNNRKDICIVSLFSGVILFILALSIFFMLAKASINLALLEMPVIYVIRNFYKSFIHIYAFIILVSIYTTAISIGISFINNISTTLKASYPLIALIMCITGFVISGFGFSNLVTNLYPFFGYLGIFQISLILLKKLTNET